MKDLVIGVDIGTSSIKAAVVTLRGERIGTASEKVSVIRSKDGFSGQDMNVVWEVVASCINNSMRAAKVSGDAIAAVACAGQGDGAWMIDKTGKPLGQAVLWNDTRAGEIVNAWKQNGLLAKVYAKTATALWPGAMAPIMAWFRDTNPGVIKSLGTVFCCKDWINYCLTGEIATDRSDGTIPFTNVETRRIDHSILKDLDLSFLDDKIPAVKDSFSVIGTVHNGAALKTGLLPGTPVVTGLIDVAANAVGAGVVSSGQALLILGTTSLLAASFGESPRDNRTIGATVLHAVDKQWLRVFGAQSGTPNVDWMAHGFNLLTDTKDGKIPDFILIDKLIETSPAGARGVLYHPFLGGERAPFVEPNAASGFFGINALTNAGDLCRSVYEGVALSAKHCLTEMDFAVKKIAITGGGARSDVWCRIIADVMNCELVVPEGEELGIRGAAITAGVGIGLYTSYEEAAHLIVKEHKRYFPNPENVHIYDDLFPIYRGLIDSMKEYWGKRKAFLEKHSVYG
ncbi:carbohydrate kinase [Treponema primitia]|uniref:FGGY-family carbohydrate kinase n=1 Tax=Treponema primitia TaxID=88058 RepID=UPI00397FC993